MNNSIPWCSNRSHNPSFLNATVAFVNSSRSRDEDIGRCEELCKALNKTWNAFFQYRSRIGELNETERRNDAEGKRSDIQSLREFLLHGMNEQQASAVCGTESVRRLAGFTPHIMNHDTLLKQRYDPLNITEDVGKKASDEHRQLSKAFERFAKSPQ